MLTQMLAILHDSLILLFGVLISAFFLGVKQNLKNTLRLLAFGGLLGALVLPCYNYLGSAMTGRIYPLIVHLPLVLFLYFYYKYPMLSCCVSMFTAYLCCQISNWVGLLILTLSGSNTGYYLARIITTIAVFECLRRYVCPTTERIFARNRHSMFVIGSLPAVYYVFDYAFTKFSNLLYSTNKTIAEFMSFTLCLAYLLFLLVYFREYENRKETQQDSELIKMQVLSLQKEIRQVKKSEQAMAILRHDMRHHLNVILAQLQDNQPEEAISYIHQVSDSYIDTEVTVYSEDQMLNAVLSIWHSRFEEKGLKLEFEISLGGKLSCSELALCTILSNALENAKNALAEAEDITEKWAHLKLFQKGDKLMIQMENPCGRVPRFVDGVPVARQKGHGVGTRSIVYFVEKLNGQCSFSVQEQIFTLRIII